MVNAINIWRTDIDDNSFPYKGIMASRSKIEDLFSRLGIKNEDKLSFMMTKELAMHLVYGGGFNKLRIQ